MNFAKARSRRKLLINFFLACPLSMLLVQAAQWLRFGIDMPLWDDWNDYRTQEVGSFDLSFLFRHGNDTIYPVGRLLDSIAFPSF